MKRGLFAVFIVIICITNVLIKGSIYALFLIPLIFILLIYTKNYFFLILSLIIIVTQIFNCFNVKNNINIYDKCIDKRFIITGTIFSIKEKINYTELKISGCNIKNKDVKVLLKVDKNNNYRLFDDITASIIIDNMDEAIIDGTFDEKLYLYSNDIFIKASLEKIISIKYNNNILKLSQILYYKILNLTDNIINSEIKQVYRALLIGSNGIEDIELKNIFNVVGLAHIFAISGLHFTLIFNVLNKLLTFCRLNKYINVIITIIFLLLYLSVCGFTISAVRAFVMIIMSLIAKLIYRSYDSITALSFVGIYSIINNPYVIYSYAFILSYGITLIVIYISTKKMNYIKNIFYIYLFSIPLLIFCFYEVPTYVLIGTIFIVPLIEFIISSTFVSMVLSIINVFITKILIVLNATMINYFIYVSWIISKLPYIKILFGHKNIIFIILSYILMITALEIKSYKNKRMILIIASILILFIKMDTSKLHILTIDDNRIIFVQSKNRIIMLSDKKVNDYTYNNFVKPFLKYNGVDKCSYIGITDKYDKSKIFNITGFNCDKIDENIIINGITYKVKKDMKYISYGIE